MKIKIIITVFLCVLLSFSYSQSKKSDCTTIKRSVLKNAKTFSDFIPDLNGCTTISYQIAGKMKGKVVTATGKGDRPENIMYLYDKDSNIYLDLRASCGGKNVSKTYCFKPED